ncbi:MAG: STAS domain-containing protein [Bacteroidales bacterium]|nr:STAS domain-containing protein [Bacteroidales bacterium]
MEIKINRQEETIIISFIGRFDTAAFMDVNKAVEPLLAEADKSIILDCEEMSYISSSGLRTFLTIRKASQAKGGRVVIKGMNDSIRSVFMMTGFLNLFEVE